MDDLMTWLRAQLDDDEQTFAALDSTARNGIESTAGSDALAYIERGPDEVAAKRRILALHEPKLVRSPKTVTELGPVDPGPPVTQALHRRREMRDYWICPTCCDGRCYEAPSDEHESRVPYCCETTRLMALPYSGRDGYRLEWAPQDVPATPS